MINNRRNLKPVDFQSEVANNESNETFIAQKDIRVSSNFTGILIKAKIKGNYEVWEKSFKTEDLKFKFQESYVQPYHLLAILALVLIVLVMIILRLSKRMKE